MHSRLRSIRGAYEDRTGKSVTYDELAKYVGTSKNTIARYFSHEPLKNINTKVVAGLAHYFDVEWHELFEVREVPTVE
jgi:Helix-turn-helix.